MANTYSNIVGMIPDEGVTTPDDAATDSPDDQVDKEATLNTAQEKADQHRKEKRHKYLDAAISRTCMVSHMINYFESIPTGETSSSQCNPRHLIIVKRRGRCEPTDDND